MSVPDDLDQNPFSAESVEFAVKDLFPGAEVEGSVGDGDDDFAAHEGAFEVGICVVLAAVVGVLGMGMFRGELFEPAFEIGVEPGFIVVDENRGGNVHGVDQAEPLLNRALTQTFLDVLRDIDQTAARRHFKPEFFSIGFHGWMMPGGRWGREEGKGGACLSAAGDRGRGAVPAGVQA